MAVSSNAMSDQVSNQPEIKSLTKKELLKKGDEFYEAEAYKEALEAYEQAIALDGSDAEAHRWRAIALQKLRQFNEALLAINRS